RPDGANEPIPPPRHCLDELRRLRVVPEYLPQRADVTFQGALTYSGMGPDCRGELLFRDQPARVLDQIAQHDERLRRQRNRLRPVPKLFVDEIKTKGMEHDDGFHYMAPPARWFFSTRNFTTIPPKLHRNSTACLSLLVPSVAMFGMSKKEKAKQ